MNANDWDRIAENYYEEVLSPLKDSVLNPLLDDLRQLAKTHSAIIDLGCGLGELAPFLAKHFRRVVGVDYAPRMLKKAEQQHSRLSVVFRQADLKNLQPFYTSFPVAVSVNSLVTPQLADVDRMLREVFRVLTPGGTFLAVVPSMEVYLYQAQLIMERELGKGKTQSQARKAARSLIKKEEHDFLTGTFTYDEETVKGFFAFELRHRLRKAGFAHIVVDKVLYSWKAFAQAGQAYFPKAALPWDWYVRCEKPA